MSGCEEKVRDEEAPTNIRGFSNNKSSLDYKAQYSDSSVLVPLVTP